MAGLPGSRTVFTPKGTEEWSNDMHVRVEVTSLPLKQLR